MFTVSMVLHGQTQPIVLRFLKSEHADRCFRRASEAIRGETPGPTLFTDDFDMAFMVVGGGLAFAVKQDIARVHDAENRMQLIAARANADLQSEARKDPVLANAARMMQMQPGGNGLIRPQ